MAKQPPIIRQRVLLITYLAILGGLLIPGSWVEDNILLFASVLILGGIPHGASDYLIFKELLGNQRSRRKQLVFLLFYLLLIVVYSLIWWKSPLLAFSIFMILSLYHFGQSNWEYVDFPNLLWRNTSYFLWGALVVIFPVLLYHEEASLIIFEITGYRMPLSSFRWPVIFMILLSNIMNIIYLWDRGHIADPIFRRELAHVGILAALFITTPLLIGFGVYFVFWHSMGTIFDQLAILNRDKRTYQLRTYTLKLLPFTLIALLGLGLLYMVLGDHMNQGLNIGILFLFISIITVPHSILMDRFYLIRDE